MGKLLLMRGSGSDEIMMLRASWFDSAPDLRCAWPRLPAGAADEGSASGSMLVFVGLELIAPSTPSRESPPTNSLPRRLCPLEASVVGASSSSGVRGGVMELSKPDVSSELKLKLGSSVDWARLCVSGIPCIGGLFECIETGRLISGAGGCRLGEREARGSAGKAKSELGTISIFGALLSMAPVSMALMLPVCLWWTPETATSAIFASPGRCAFVRGCYVDHWLPLICPGSESQLSLFGLLTGIRGARRCRSDMRRCRCGIRTGMRMGMGLLERSKRCQLWYCVLSAARSVTATIIRSADEWLLSARLAIRIQTASRLPERE